MGQSAVACYNPLTPADGPEHLILPDLELSFVRAQELDFPGPRHTISLDAMIDKEHLKRLRPKIRFLEKVKAEFLSGVREAFGEQQALHGELERHYIQAMDYDRLNNMQREVTRHIEGLLRRAVPADMLALQGGWCPPTFPPCGGIVYASHPPRVRDINKAAAPK